MRQIRKIVGNQQGFTLVEILVVLVILAIMAAVSIPSMKGFIDDANKKSYLTEARSVYVACQSAASELAAWTDSPEEHQVIDLAQELLADDIDSSSFSVKLNGSKVTSITYAPKKGVEITINLNGEVTYGN